MDMTDKKHLCLLFFLLSGLVSSGQEFMLKSQVKDAENGEALPFANIMLSNQEKGISADIGGYFSLLLSEDQFQDTLVVSFMGYHEKRICVCDIDNNNSIQLESKVYLLDTYRFNYETKETVVLNTFKERKCFVPYSNKLSENEVYWFPYRPHEPTIEALFFPSDLSGNKRSFIKEVWIYTRSYSIPAYFRLRIFEADEKNRPSNDLVRENIIVEINQKDELIKTDLRKFDLVFPENGVFIGFELLIKPENKKELSVPDNSGSIILYSPYLQYYPVKKHDFIHWTYSGGLWQKELLDAPSTMNNKVSKPAISLVIEQ